LKNTSFEGIISDIYISDSSVSFELDGKYKIKCNYYEEYNTKLKLGDKVIVYGDIYIPSNNSNFNLFNYNDYLKSKNIYYIVSVSSYKKVSDNRNVFYFLKNNIISLINNNCSYKYLYAFILGDNRYINDDISSNYQELGISHLFSISGMHVGILSSVLLWLMKKIKLNEEIRSFITCIFIIFFMFLVNLCPSVLRSGIFFVLITINNIYYFHIKSINLLLLTVSIIIFMNPFIIYNNGFLFSSIITGSLIGFSSIINRKNSYIGKLFMTSFISFIFSFPLSIYSYYQINILSVFYNLIFVPLVSIVIFPFSLISLFIPFLGGFLNILINFMEILANFFSMINTNVIFMKPSFYILVFYYIFIVFMFKFRNKFLYIIFIIIILIHYNYNFIFPSNYMIMIDVGQGDSMLLHSGNFNILVDTGGNTYNSGSISKNTLIPLFKSLGIRKIDHLFLSHGDYDHLGESYHLVNNFKVSNVYFNEGELNDNENKLINLLKNKNINYFISYDGDFYKIGDYSLYSLGTNLNDENDSSMILYGMISNYSFLLMGDASIKSEDILLNKYNISNIDILKVGHHGSKTSSSFRFINKINPKYSLISVGKDNKFKHPNKEVLDNLNVSTVYRTDIEGSIMILFYKDKFRVKTNKA